MKIAVRGGHCPCIPGASKFVDELTEDRKVTESVIKYLKQLGHEVFNVTPPDDITTSVGDLSFGVIKANTYKVDLFVSIHFNKAYNIYNGDLGSEVCVYCPFDTAQRVVNGLAYLGFKNRGQKVRTNLYELKHTSMKAMIIEVCFVESTGDVSLYKRLGYEAPFFFRFVISRPSAAPSLRLRALRNIRIGAPSRPNRARIAFSM